MNLVYTDDEETQGALFSLPLWPRQRAAGPLNMGGHRGPGCHVMRLSRSTSGQAGTTTLRDAKRKKRELGRRFVSRRSCCVEAGEPGAVKGCREDADRWPCDTTRGARSHKKREGLHHEAHTNPVSEGTSRLHIEIQHILQPKVGRHGKDQHTERRAAGIQRI